MYADVLDDPKVQKLPPELFKAWVNLLCLASRNDGVLPAVEDIAFALRMSQDVTVTVTTELVTRGLLDECDGLSPHNWAERQFKSDTPEDAKERKRKQRAREKQSQNPDNVTECHSDSHSEVTPPEQNRTEQIRTHTEGVRDKDPSHWDEVGDFLKTRSSDVNDWELDFLHSIKWSRSLTPSQADKLKAIRERLKSSGNGGFALPSVKRGTPQYDAWIAHYRKTKGKATFYEKLDALTVPSEYPPQEQAA
jgi:hypothetical protein